MKKRYLILGLVVILTIYLCVTVRQLDRDNRMYLPEATTQIVRGRIDDCYYIEGIIDANELPKYGLNVDSLGPSILDRLEALGFHRDSISWDQILGGETRFFLFIPVSGTTGVSWLCWEPIDMAGEVYRIICISYL